MDQILRALRITRATLPANSPQDRAIKAASDEIERLRAEVGAILGHAHGWGLHKNCPCGDDDCPFS